MIRNIRLLGVALGGLVGLALARPAGLLVVTPSGALDVTPSGGISLIAWMVAWLVVGFAILPVPHDRAGELALPRRPASCRPPSS